MNNNKKKIVFANYTDLKTMFSEDTIKTFFPKPDMLVKKGKDKELWLYYAERVKNQILKHKIPVAISYDFQYLHKKLYEIIKDTVEEASKGIYKEPKKKTVRNERPLFKKETSYDRVSNLSKLKEQKLNAEKVLEEMNNNNKPRITLKRKG